MTTTASRMTIEDPKSGEATIIMTRMFDAPIEKVWECFTRPEHVKVWFGGQEMANAIVDVLMGDADPGGRLPTTIPLRIEHNPSFGNFPGANGQVRYGEGVFVGYRWYEARHLPTRFPFGHGLSYSSFEIGAPAVRRGDDGDIQVSVAVTNTGARTGSEVVQCYVSPPDESVRSGNRPPKELKAFAKVRLEPGESRTVVLSLERRCFASWQPVIDAPPAGMSALPLSATDPFPASAPGWVVSPGTFGVHVGRSSADIAHAVWLDIAG